MEEKKDRAELPTRSASQRAFPLGQVVITCTAANTLAADDVTNALQRHVAGDWGAVGPEDARENELALRENLRLLSIYTDQKGTKFWIITEADRSATTVLLPEDY